MRNEFHYLYRLAIDALQEVEQIARAFALTGELRCSNLYSPTLRKLRGRTFSSRGLA